MRRNIDAWWPHLEQGAEAKGKPDVIASANIGCQMHLASKAGVPVKHWIELIDEVLEAKV